MYIVSLLIVCLYLFFSQKDTMKVIFSYHTEDPDGVQRMQWHGIKQRGAHSLRLLSAQTSHNKIPTDTISIDFTSNRVSKTV